MTSTQDMIRGRSNIVTMTNNSGGALVAGDVCVQDTTADENVTTTTSAASTLKVFVAAESIAAGATGKFYESGYCPFVNVSASATRGYFLFTHTVAKQAATSATYGTGAFGKVLKAGTSPSVIIYSQTAQVGSGVTRSGSTTDAHWAVWNGSNADSLKDGGAVASGGNVTYESAYSSPPATPNSGDVWYITDSLLHARYNGSAWQYYHGTKLVYKPVLSQFTTWFNQSTTTLDDHGELVLYTPTGSTNYIRGKVMTAPALNYTIDMIIKFGLTGTTYMGAGFCWSDGTGYIHFGLSEPGTTRGLHVDKWTNTTAFSASYATIALSPWLSYPTDPIYLRVTEDGSNRSCYYSLDQGNHYHLVHQVGRTDFLTATQVGIMTYKDNATYEPQMSLLSWHAY